MANLTFLTNTLTGLTYNWSTKANWDTGNVPVNNDSVTLPTGNGNAITYTSLDDIALLTLNDLNANNGVTLDVGATDSLTVQANLFSNAGLINVFGTLTVQNITSASNSGTIDADGGTVTLQNINDQAGSFIIEAGGKMTISYSGNVNGSPTFFLRDGLLEFQSNTPGQADVDFTGSAAGHLAFNTATNGNATNNSLDNMGLGDSIEFIDANITAVSYNNSSKILTLTTDQAPRAVRWLWRQTVVAAFADELRSYPIRIRAGALDQKVPERDLFLSPDHAILVDGCLVQAAALVNNTTVTRVLNPEPKFVYYHIELEDHALVLAEGVASETFVDNVTRRRFDNYADYEAMYGADEVPVIEMDFPRAKSARQLPRVVRERLAARSNALSVVGREAA